MGVFEDRQRITAAIDRFANAFFATYDKQYQEKCPTLHRSLPFLRQGINCVVAYGAKPFLVMARESRQPAGQYIAFTWDETEYSQLCTASTVDTIAEILELEEVLYSKELDSLESKYIDEVMGRRAAIELAERLLEENMRMAWPTLEDAVHRMKAAYELLFRLENSLRQIIEQELKKHFGETDWWEKGATYAAKKESLNNRKDPRWKWHEPINASPLNYVDFVILHDIIVNKNWGIFEHMLGPRTTFSSNLKNLEVPRNLIAHNNVLSQQEFYDFRRNVERLLGVIKPYLSKIVPAI